MQSERVALIHQQKRSFWEGALEYINDEWVFFAEEEALLLEEFYDREVYIYRGNGWMKGILIAPNRVCSDHGEYILHGDEWIKIRKSLPYALEMLIEELSDEAFFTFIWQLNQLDFSLYDALYCYNQFVFLGRLPKEGVNFMIFDNGRQICSVQHVFTYDQELHDRFEFTLNTNQRFIVQGIQPRPS